MSKIARLLTAVIKWKVLRALWLVFLGVLGYVLVSNDLVHFQIERSLGTQEAVRGKPPVAAVIVNELDVKTEDGRAVGRLLKNTVVYLEARPKDGQSDVIARLYGWIWANSVVERDGFLTLTADENVRYRANSHLLGRLLGGTVLFLEYENEAKSWCLFRTNLRVPTSGVRVLASQETRGFWARLKEPRSVVAVTSKNGGIPVTYNVLEPTLMFLLLVLASITGLAGIRRMPIDHRKDFYLEVLKGGLQVGVGVLLAFLIFGLGLK